MEGLRLAAGARTGVHIYQGDANVLLLDRVFPQVQLKSRWDGVSTVIWGLIMARE